MSMPFATTFSDYNLELLGAADILVSGATTYRGFVSYWPPVADDATQPEVERAISRRHRDLEHLVVSDTLTPDETGPWRGNTRIVGRDEAADSQRMGCSLSAAALRRAGGETQLQEPSMAAAAAAPCVAACITAPSSSPEGS